MNCSQVGGVAASTSLNLRAPVMCGNVVSTGKTRMHACFSDEKADAMRGCKGAMLRLTHTHTGLFLDPPSSTMLTLHAKCNDAYS